MSALEKRRAVFVQSLIDEGYSYQQIGTHSWRKGAASYAASGTTAAPSIVSICIRAGWKISSVLKRYLSMENAGDWFLGRVVAGLPIYDKKFSVLPPRFKSNMTDAVDSHPFHDPPKVIIRDRKCRVVFITWLVSKSSIGLIKGVRHLIVAYGTGRNAKLVQPWAFGEDY